MQRGSLTVEATIVSVILVIVVILAILFFLKLELSVQKYDLEKYREVYDKKIDKLIEMKLHDETR